MVFATFSTSSEEAKFSKCASQPHARIRTVLSSSAALASIWCNRYNKHFILFIQYRQNWSCYWYIRRSICLFIFLFSFIHFNGYILVVPRVAMHMHAVIICITVHICKTSSGYVPSSSHIRLYISSTNSYFSSVVKSPFVRMRVLDERRPNRPALVDS
jgi:hypothetical protein